MIKAFTVKDYKFTIEVILDYHTEQYAMHSLDDQPISFDGRVHDVCIRHSGRVFWQKEYNNCPNDQLFKAIKDFEKQAEVWVESRKDIDPIKEELQHLGFK